MVFPGARQVAKLNRNIDERKTETVYLITSMEPELLDAAEWLKYNRQAWGIESGLHQRLDVSGNEDRCRVRTRNASWILCMFRRLSVSLFCHWRSKKKNSKYLTMTDFYTNMDFEGHRRAFLLVSSKHPAIKGKI
jgi:predicted transposase YbfD/YdcC